VCVCAVGCGRGVGCVVWCVVWAGGGMCSVVCGVGVLVLPRIRFNRHRAVRQLEVRERCFERVSSLEMAGDGGRSRGRWREMARAGV
jgi:Flp pilus assembly protein TadB